MTRREHPVRAFIVALLVLAATEAQAAGTGDTSIIAPGTVLQKAFGDAEFTEGPAAGPDGCIYFSDLTFEGGAKGQDGNLMRFDPRSLSCTVYRSPSGMSNGIEFDRDGKMIVAQGSDFGGRGIVSIDLATGKGKILVSRFNGALLNSPNDLVIDSRNRIYFTDPRYGDEKSISQPVKGVYRLDPDGKTTLLIGDIPMPNGIAISPDESTLYVGCCVPPINYIAAYPLASDGTIGARRMFVKYPGDLCPDGFAIDQSGHLYVAERKEAAAGIGVFDPQGKKVAFLPTPEVPSNVAFGRAPEDGMLYITAGRSLYRIATTQHGYFIPVR
jgi:gluconolactonase